MRVRCFAGTTGQQHQHNTPELIMNNYSAFRYSSLARMKTRTILHHTNKVICHVYITLQPGVALQNSNAYPKTPRLSDRSFLHILPQIPEGPILPFSCSVPEHRDSTKMPSLTALATTAGRAERRFTNCPLLSFHSDSIRD